MMFIQLHFIPTFDTPDSLAIFDQQYHQGHYTPFIPNLEPGLRQSP
jgi:hypothetical protein